MSAVRSWFLFYRALSYMCLYIDLVDVYHWRRGSRYSRLAWEDCSSFRHSPDEWWPAVCLQLPEALCQGVPHPASVTQWLQRLPKTTSVEGKRSQAVHYLFFSFNCSSTDVIKKLFCNLPTYKLLFLVILFCHLLHWKADFLWPLATTVSWVGAESCAL